MSQISDKEFYNSFRTVKYDKHQLVSARYAHLLRRRYTSALTKYLIENPNFKIPNIPEMVSVFASKGGTTFYKHLESKFIPINGAFTTQSDALRLIKLMRYGRVGPDDIKEAILNCPDIIPIIHFKKLNPTSISDSYMRDLIYRFWEQIGPPSIGKITTRSKFLHRECEQYLGPTGLENLLSTIRIMKE